MLFPADICCKPLQCRKYQKTNAQYFVWTVSRGQWLMKLISQANIVCLVVCGLVESTCKDSSTANNVYPILLTNDFTLCDNINWGDVHKILLLSNNNYCNKLNTHANVTCFSNIWGYIYA